MIRWEIEKERGGMQTVGEILVKPYTKITQKIHKSDTDPTQILLNHDSDLTQVLLLYFA